MIGAALLAVLFRVNLPVAMLTTLYTNPFTILPLYVLAYELGAFVGSYHDGSVSAPLAIPDMDLSNWYTVLPGWLLSLGKPFALGLPLLAIILAAAGYFAVRLLWYWLVISKWKMRAARRKRDANMK